MPPGVAALFAPGGRFGWEYVEPQPARLSPELHREPVFTQEPTPLWIAEKKRKREAAQEKLQAHLIIVGVVAAIGWIVAAANESGGFAFFILIVVGVMSGVWFLPLATTEDRRQLELRDREEQAFRAAHAQWHSAVESWNRGEAQRVDHALRYYPLHDNGGAGTRVDVIGGRPASWAALLLTHGASVLAEGRSFTLLDLTEDDAARDLCDVATAAGIPVSRQEMPADLEDAGLLAGLTDDVIGDLLSEAVQGRRPGPYDPSLGSIDSEIITSIAKALGANVTFARLAAGARVLAGLYDLDSGVLTVTEVERLSQEADRVHSGERVQGELQFVRTQLELLVPAAGATGFQTPEPAGSRGAPEDVLPEGGARITLLTSASPVRGRKAITDQVLVQFLTHRLGTSVGARGESVAVIGADNLRRWTVESLTDRARRRGVSLMLLSAHLRDDTKEAFAALGGTTLVMGLANQAEAMAAAEHVGRGHRFVLSQLNVTSGTTHTTGGGTTTGWSETRGNSSGRSGGASYGWSSGSNNSFSENFSSQRNWSEAVSRTEGHTEVRSYDFTVEPAALQALDTTAFFLVESRGGERRVVLGNCDPQIALLDRVSAAPRPLAGKAPDALRP